MRLLSRSFRGAAFFIEIGVETTFSFSALLLLHSPPRFQRRARTHRVIFTKLCAGVLAPVRFCVILSFIIEETFRKIVKFRVVYPRRAPTVGFFGKSRGRTFRRSNISSPPKPEKEKIMFKRARRCWWRDCLLFTAA